MADGFRSRDGSRSPDRLDVGAPEAAVGASSPLTCQRSAVALGYGVPVPYRARCRVMSRASVNGAGPWRERVARWWGRLRAEWRGATRVERGFLGTSYALIGASAVLTPVGIVTSEDTLIWLVAGAGMAACGCLLIYLALVARRDRRLWAAAPQPVFELALVGSDLDAVVKRRSLAARAAFLCLGVGCAGAALNIALDGSSPLWLRFTGSSGFLAFGTYIASFAGHMLVATQTLIAVRTSRGWRSASWNEVRAIEPTHQGLVFELEDGRKLVAAVTAPNGFAFLPPRYDRALVEALRARLP